MSMGALSQQINEYEYECEYEAGGTAPAAVTFVWQFFLSDYGTGRRQPAQINRQPAAEYKISKEAIL
jgi:hypothetical protein